MPEMLINSVVGSEPLTETDFKNYIRIDTDADDGLLENMIVTAREWCEMYISSDIVAKSRTYYQEDVEHGEVIDLPFGDVSSISSVTAEGSAVGYTTKGVGSNRLILNSTPAKDVKITYTTAGLNNQVIKSALKMFVSTLYDNRASFVTGTIVTELPLNVQSILDPYKQMYI
jgi:uncharacterized phiE125 gp8 family phage protein